MVNPETSEDDIVSEADAQGEETIMPWLWGACGLVLIAGFVAWVLVAAPHGHHLRPPAGPAPLMHSLDQHN